MEKHQRIALSAMCLGCLLSASPVPAAILTFSDADFVTTPVFSNVTNFSFTIDIAAPLAPGAFINPTLNGVVYSVKGGLAATPSGFPAFDLQRTIDGSDFYAQGSSLAFEIAAGANLADGLQISDLAGPDPVFVFDGREVGTGRYHPALLRLNADGSGSIQNSNNTGGVNPASMQEVDVDFGEEYVTNLSFDPATLTIAAVPVPSALVLLISALAFGAAVRAR